MAEARKEATMENVISVEHLWKKYTTYKRESGFKDSVKSFFHREKVYVDAVKDVSFQVKKGDIIKKIDNIEIKNKAYFNYYLFKHQKNDNIKITYIRDGKENNTIINLK